VRRATALPYSSESPSINTAKGTPGFAALSRSKWADRLGGALGRGLDLAVGQQGRHSRVDGAPPKQWKIAMSSALNSSPTVAETEFAGRRALLVLVLGAMMLAGAWLRFTALDRIELFVDEGGHILAPVDPDVCRVINPIGEGKPAMIWFFRIASALPADPLVVARSVVAACGLITAVAIAATLFLLLDLTAALVGFALWLFLPFAVFHERLALFDPVIAMLIACGLLALALGSRPSSRRLDPIAWSALGGALAGAACLLKISASTAAPWLLVCYVALQRRWARPLLSERLAAASVAYALPAITLCALAPQLGERILAGSGPAAATAGGLRFLGWYAGYGGWPLALLALLAIAGLRAERARSMLCFGAAWLGSLVIAQAIYPAPYARYVHADHILLVIFLAGAIAGAPTRISLSLATVALAGWFWVGVRIVRDPQRAPIPADEIEQYLTGPWSGSGAAGAIAQIAKHRPSVVFVHRYSRPASYAALLAARQDPELNVVPLSLETSRGVDGARAVAAKARALLGANVRFYVLAEGAPPPERATLAGAGVSCRVIYDHLKPDGVSRVMVLECDL